MKQTPTINDIMQSTKIQFGTSGIGGAGQVNVAFDGISQL
jgi:hypothetical protein